MSSLDSNYVPPSRQTLINTIIPSYLIKAKTILQNEINNSTSICLTIDGWSCNYTQKHFFSLTGHYIFGNKLKSVVLKLEKFDDKHTAENVKDYIIKCKTEWNLNRFGEIFIMSDNAPEMLSGINLSNNLYLGCSCHRLDKVIKKTIERMEFYKELINKVKKTCTKFKNTPLFSNILENIQEEIGGCLKVLISVDTRWFSELTMTERFYNIRNEIEGVVEAYIEEIEDEDMRQFILTSFLFSENEYIIMKFFIDTFMTIYKKSEKLSGDSSCTLSDLIPTIKSLHGWLKHTLENLKNSPSELSIIRKNISLMVGDVTYNSFIDYEEEETNKTNIYSISSQIIEDNINSIKYQFINTIITVLEEQFFTGTKNIMNDKTCLLSTFFNPKYIKRYFNINQLNDTIEYIKQISNEEIQVSQTLRQQETNDVNDDIMEFGMEITDDKNNLSIDDEITKYLQKQTIDLNADFSDIVHFWDIHMKELPFLYKIAQKYLVNLASSASSERLFSVSGTYFEKRRTRMLGSTLESECILKSFIDNNGIDQLI